jgi:polar amino acid transport system ATP-binding protein
VSAELSPLGAPLVTPTLEFRQIKKRFGEREVLRGVDLTVAPGEVVCVVGPSGSGKSTLLRLATRLERPDGGLVLLDGEPVGVEQRGGQWVERKESDVARMRGRVGMVFQDFALFTNKTALDNVTLGPIRAQRRDAADARARATSLLERVGLAHRASAYPSQLSGGEQQRVAIARALALDPVLMLFDEPTSALDPERVSEVLTVIAELAKDGRSMLIVTHELDFAAEVAHTIAFIDDGRVVEVGPARQVLEHPREARTNEFLRRLLARATAVPPETGSTPTRKDPT